MRPSRHAALMETALIWGSRSTCSRLQVGCVIAREGRILVQGYNGAPAGLPHCNHTCDCDFPLGISEVHSPWCKSLEPCTQAEHAERNAVAWAARNGVKLERSDLYVTDAPCLSCAMAVINSGVEKAYYYRPYRLTNGIELLKEAGIEVVKWQSDIERKN